MTETPLSAAAIVERVTAGDLTPGAVVDESLRRIEAVNGELNAFSVVLANEAREQARFLALGAGEAPGPLYGVPVAIKEELDVAGCVTTFGGRANSTPAASDGEVVRRLREAGAIIVGKTQMPEFGAWPYTESVAYGHTRNPWDTRHTPGGSSGGTAAAVASGMVPVGMGGDGGGSIRIPAACCGLFGLKPQRGRVTTAPMEHLWWALGTVGPLSRTVLDSAIVYDVIRGNLPTDRWRAGEVGSFADAARRDPGRLRIGWTVKPVTRGVKPHPEHVAAVRDTARLLTGLGHDVREVDPRYPDPTTAFVPQFFAGIRAEADAVEHYDRLEQRTRETCRLGSWVTPRVIDFALRRTEQVSARANRVFADIDVLLTPSMAHRPPPVGVLDGTGTVRASLKAMPAIAYAALWNLAGNPACSVPSGTGTDGLPIGCQLVGRTDGEETLLSLAAQLEATRPWPLVAP
ncbi:amidase [Nocardioides cynanchi]|uniref:amidase n=1 Tax=Nocardioides cynanchi TaxID=2558918 RepID=UPI001247A404|nr:amidase [Nocardioides cynanchi]